MCPEDKPKCKHKDTTPCWRDGGCTLRRKDYITKPISNCCIKYYKLGYWKCLDCGDWLKGIKIK